MSKKKEKLEEKTDTSKVESKKISTFKKKKKIKFDNKFKHCHNSKLFK